ncbi:MAG: hypothetical protein R3C11_16950 [Planctomycetaceae bacterium]
MSVTITAMSAIDMALWDLKGKALWRTDSSAAGWETSRQVPGVCFDLVWKKMDRRPARSDNAGSRTVTPPLSLVGKPMGQSEQLDKELVAGAREGLGDATLLIDAGCVWDARTSAETGSCFC